MGSEEQLLQEIITRLDKMASGFQPADADLTAIAALTTTAFGRNLLTLVNAAAGPWDVAGLAAAAEIAAKAYADGLVVGLWDDRGNFNASVNAYPSSGGSGVAGAIKKGDIWTISVAGTLPTGQLVEIGDTVRALIDTPGNTQANWAIAQQNIGYVPENAANKSTNISADTGSNTKYPSVAAVEAAITAGGTATSGEYTPVLTGVANITGVSGGHGQWLRIGSYVHVFGQLVIESTLTATDTQVGISLPIASDFGSSTNIQGSATRNTNVVKTAYIENDNANDRANLHFTSDAVIGAWGWEFSFSYKII